MYDQLRKHILPQLIPPKTRVMIAVSGGPDSMALSHILWRYVREESARENSLVLTHVHHGVRKESDDEVELVQQMAKKWDIPCLIHCFDAKQYAKSTGQSFQAAAREWRYARWKEDMIQEECSLLATAHHLGDQAETILYRMLRGSGTAGLAGMYPSKGSIIRPLLTFKKSEILNYCGSEAVPYALDRSNEETIYVRNRIRLELLPELEKSYNSRIQEALGRTGELLRWDEEYLAEQVEVAWSRYYNEGPIGAVSLHLEVFQEPAAILSRILRKAAMQVTHEPRGLGFTYIDKIMASQGKQGWMQDLPGLKVEVTKEGLQFRSPRVNDAQSDGVINKTENQSGLNLEIPLIKEHWAEVPSLKIAIGLFGEESFFSLDSQQRLENKTAVFSRGLLDRTSDQPLVCRTRRKGDKMWFQGVGHKTLKKVFQEGKIGQNARIKMPVIAYGTEVLWIPGVRQSGQYHSDSSSEKIYLILVPLSGHSNLH